MDGDLCCMSCPENPDKDAYPPLVLELPFPPSVNHYWRSVRIGNATRTLISAHAPDNRRRDLDNFGGKALLDALTHAGVWLDDSQVRRLSMEWGENIRGGKAVVQIRRIA